MSDRAALEKLLLSCFDVEALRLFVGHLPDGDRLRHELPGLTVSVVTFIGSTVDALARHGVLDTPDFWTRLAAERPLRARDIAAVQATFLPGSPPPAPTPAATPDQLLVLMVAASPDVAVRLRVDLELKQIIDTVRAAQHGALVRFEQVHAASFDDLRRALLRHEPHVLVSAP